MISQDELRRALEVAGPAGLTAIQLAAALQISEEEANQALALAVNRRQLLPIRSGAWRPAGPFLLT